MAISNNGHLAPAEKLLLQIKGFGFELLSVTLSRCLISGLTVSKADESNILQLVPFSDKIDRNETTLPKQGGTSSKDNDQIPCFHVMDMRHHLGDAWTNYTASLKG